MRWETGAAKAERIINEELKRLGWSEAELLWRRKSDPGKLQKAAGLRRETTLSIKEIAVRLHLGTARSASVRLQTIVSEPSPCPSSGRIVAK